MYPPQLHPVVSIHPVSKKKVLFVNPQFTVGINGMNENESRALLDLLFRQALVPEYQFRHHWEPHTIACGTIVPPSTTRSMIITHSGVTWSGWRPSRAARSAVFRARTFQACDA